MHCSITNVTKRYGPTTVLDRASLETGDIRTLVLIGPSGGGKSTLLRIAAGLVAAEEGEVLVDGLRAEPTLQWRRRTGVVFQGFNLFPHLTALENVQLPLWAVHGQTQQQAADVAMDALKRFRLEQHAHKHPAQLSGGQNQRVAIARAIATKPRLLFFDEPTSALDPEMTGEVLDMIEELKKEGRNLVLVTHQMGFARVVADRVAFLHGGRILESGTATQIFDSPQTPECRDFLQRVLRY